MIFGLTLSAQHGNSIAYQFNKDGNYNTSNTYDYRDENLGDRRNRDDRYRDTDRYDRRGNELDRRRRYKRKTYRVRFNRLSYRDQRRITKLERKYVRTEEFAWEDGYLSRRERRSLRSIQRDIDRIWARYERNRNDGYGNYGTCG